jgi:hypothetical protein
MKSVIILLLFFSIQASAANPENYNSLPSVSIPTAGNSWLVNDPANNKVITNNGITGWTDAAQVIRTFFRTEKKGKLNISIVAKNRSGSSEIKAAFENKEKKIVIKNVTYDTIPLGEFTVTSPGYCWLELKGISKSSQVFADVKALIIDGPASEGVVTYVKDDFYFGRRGPSVHLRYEIPQEASDIQYFYNEITVPEGNDVQGSYFMADGFADGYFGIQVNSPTERRILFSVWSPYKTDKPGEIPEEYKIILLKKGPDVIAGEFGNEGSGGQSYRKFYWHSGTTYRFLLKGNPSENNSTDYAAWFFTPETGKWNLIASFRRPKTNNYLKSLYSFLENFIPETGFITRKGYYSNQWIMDSSGKWHELTKAKFTADATARKGSRLDYSGCSEDGNFVLRNCGFFNDSITMNRSLERKASGKKPEINFMELE